MTTEEINEVLLDKVRLSLHQFTSFYGRNPEFIYVSFELLQKLENMAVLMNPMIDAKDYKLKTFFGMELKPSIYLSGISWKFDFAHEPLLQPKRLRP